MMSVPPKPRLSAARRRKYSFHIADHLSGTRSLSDRDYRVYMDTVFLIGEQGGRLPMATPQDELDVRKRLSCDRRKWVGAMKALRTGDRPKLHLIGGWLTNKRTLIECDALVVALEEWGWSRSTLIDVIGVDPRDIEAAYRRREGGSESPHTAVDSAG